MQEKCFAPGGFRQMSPQGLNLTLVHQRRQCPHTIERSLKSLFIGVTGLLSDGLGTPGIV
jgi:hypothetical protein